MYRTRIRKWGIDKNNKATEVAHLLRLKKQRDVLGKKSHFLIRNRPVDWWVYLPISTCFLFTMCLDQRLTDPPGKISSAISPAPPISGPNTAMTPSLAPKPREKSPA